MGVPAPWRETLQAEAAGAVLTEDPEATPLDLPMSMWDGVRE